jgi:hypothetical protein
MGNDDTGMVGPNHRIAFPMAYLTLQVSDGRTMLDADTAWNRATLRLVASTALSLLMSLSDMKSG